jgi:hypothetical protein
MLSPADLWWGASAGSCRYPRLVYSRFDVRDLEGGFQAPVTSSNILTSKPFTGIHTGSRNKPIMKIGVSIEFAGVLVVTF